MKLIKGILIGTMILGCMADTCNPTRVTVEGKVIKTYVAPAVWGGGNEISGSHVVLLNGRDRINIAGPKLGNFVVGDSIRVFAEYRMLVPDSALLAIEVTNLK